MGSCPLSQGSHVCDRLGREASLAPVITYGNTPAWCVPLTVFQGYGVPRSRKGNVLDGHFHAMKHYWLWQTYVEMTRAIFHSIAGLGIAKDTHRFIMPFIGHFFSSGLNVFLWLPSIVFFRITTPLYEHLRYSFTTDFTTTNSCSGS